MTQNKNKGETEIEMESNQTTGKAGTSKERVVGVDIGTSKIVFSEKKNGASTY